MPLRSGILRRVSVKLSKICNDLRLLASGPRCGFGEINLPPMVRAVLLLSAVDPERKKRMVSSPA